METSRIGGCQSAAVSEECKRPSEGMRQPNTPTERKGERSNARTCLSAIDRSVGPQSYLGTDAQEAQ